jgi:hypothetical protein
MAVGQHQPAASVSVPAARGCSPSGFVGMAWKHRGELLVNAAVGVDQDVAGVAVDPRTAS